MKIIDRLSLVGGGTDETEALESAYQTLTLNNNNVIKLIYALSDGYGNEDEVARIVRQVEEDDEVIFLAIGLGSGADNVVKAYTEPLRKPESSNVFGFSAEDPQTMLPYVFDFLKKQVEEKRKARNF